MKVKVSRVIMSNLSDAQENLFLSNKDRYINNPINFAKFLILKYSNTNTEVNPDAEFSEFAKSRFYKNEMKNEMKDGGVFEQDHKRITKQVRQIIGPGKTTTERGMTSQYFDSSKYDEVKKKLQQNFRNLPDTEHEHHFEDIKSGQQISLPKKEKGARNYWVSKTYMTFEEGGIFNKKVSLKDIFTGNV